MNKRELKRRLKRKLAGYLLDNKNLEEWAQVMHQVNKTETTSTRWLVVKLELFDELFGGD